MNVNSIQNQLLYTTVKILARNNQEISMGTGFFIEYSNNQLLKNESEIFLVTNNHVVDNCSSIDIIFCSMNSNHEPDDNNHVTITINNLDEICINNSTADFCLINMKDVIHIAKAQGKEIFFKSIGLDFFITEEKINELTAIEDIIMIGYPEGLIDLINNKPVVRKGITATSIALDFNGKREFVIDAACFHGSSGSPVFLDQIGLSKTNNANSISISITHIYYFLGILYGGPFITSQGEVKVIDVPTEKRLLSQHEIMTNLGYVIKCSCIKEMIEELFSGTS